MGLWWERGEAGDFSDSLDGKLKATGRLKKAVAYGLPLQRKNCVLFNESNINAAIRATQARQS